MAWQKFESEILKAEFEKAFGIKLEDATPQMVVFFMKFGKFVRKYARNNSALHNYVRRSFPSLNYKVVRRKSTRPDGKDYDVMEITSKAKPEVAATDDEGSDE